MLSAVDARPVRVLDPFAAMRDPSMPTLTRALDPAEVEERFSRDLPALTGGEAHVRFRAARVTRHKPGRRCLIEYEVYVERPGAPPEAVTLVGKVRARGLDRRDCDLLLALWNSGFDDQSHDGISVPEPIGVIPELGIWLQREVPGQCASRILPGASGVALAWRIAEAAHKLHCAGTSVWRRHSMADELRILHERLPRVAAHHPRLETRLTRLLEACARLGTDVAEDETRGIHRDFYPDQVIVDGERLYLVDFDLYCAGDPALDIGNFLGHLTEQSLRATGDPHALDDREAALEDRFAALAGDEVRARVRTYAALTLVRHIELSTRFPDRAGWTQPLLELCELRLGLA